MTLVVGCALFCPDAVAGPDYDKVGLLLPFDESHGATSATDISRSGHVPVFNGNTKISAGRSKYGGTSCYFDGKGDYLTIAESEDWNLGTGDFTIEFWVLRTGVSQYEGILGENAKSWNSGVPVIVIYNTKILITEGKIGNKTQASTSFVANTWYHVAFSRGGGYMRLFVNGKLEDFKEDTHAYDFNELRIGRYNVGSDYDFGGYLDDLRITKGLARYSSNFELPEAMKGDALPNIALLTEPTTVAEGASVELLVTAVGAPPISYQWSKGGVEISGATQSILNLTDVALSTAGDYRVAVSNGLGEAVSEAITVTVLQPAGIDVQPVGGGANRGGSLTLEVVASGSEPISYQWHHGGVPIDGATGSTLRLTNLKTRDMGGYHVVVSNPVGEQTSETVNLSMVPTITKLTESMNPVRGTNVELSVGATGTEPMNYQWYHAGTLIEDATATTLFLNDFQANETGDYHVTVSNAGGTVTSDMVTLLMPPAITRLTDDIYVIEGDTLKLNVTPVGTPPFTYFWSHNESSLENDIQNSELMVEGVKPSDAGTYSVVVEGQVGEPVTVNITVAVLQPASIITQPIGGEPVFGESFSFEVIATGTEPIIYEWYHGGALLEEVTGSTLQLTDLESADSGEYYVVVSNERTTDSGETVSLGKETSDTVSLTVVVPPENVQIAGSMESGLNQLSATAEVTADEEEPKTYSWSESGVLAEGDTMVLTATAAGTEPFVYAWNHDGRKFDGESTESLRLAKVDDSVSGEYQVEVANDAGVETSDPMMLEVKPAGTIVELAGAIGMAEGGNVELSVTAVGAGTLSYQWSKDGATIDGATNPGYAVENVDQAAVGEYKLTVKRDQTLLGTAEITVDLLEPPVIVTQPVGGRADMGGTFTFEVIATGTEPMSYEWYFDGEAVEGGTGSTLNLTDLEEANAGDYYVTVSNAVGTKTSDTVTLGVNISPSIAALAKLVDGAAIGLSVAAVITGDEEEPTTTRWEEEAAILVGDNVGLTVTATGTEPITYQWHYGEEVVEDVTGGTLRLADVQVADSGYYHVVASNRLGEAISEVITLSVVTPPAITEVIGTISVLGGNSVELSVAATDANEAPSDIVNYFDNDLVAYYPLEDGNGLTVSDVKGENDGTLNGNVTWSIGKFNGGLEFNRTAADGSLTGPTYENGWVSVDGLLDGIGASGLLNDNDSYTFSAWAKWAPPAGGSATWGYVIWGSNTTPSEAGNVMRVGVNNDAKTLFTHGNRDLGAFDWTDQDWHLYTITFGPDGKADFYVDGNILISKDDDPDVDRERPWSSAGLFQFGMELERNLATDGWSGKLDELAIWKRELSSQDISKLFNNGSGIQLGSFGYQWSRNGELIDGATAPTLDLGVVGDSVQDEYKVEVTKAGELVGLAVINVTTAEPVIIVTQPGGGSADGVTVYYETFDDVKLGPNVDERLSRKKAWTRTGPKGWLVDRSGVPGNSEDHVGYVADKDEDGYPDNDGVSEWAGWSFANYKWWVKTAGDQTRSQFTLAKNVVAVADPDEWDDKPHARSAANGWYKTLLKTPKIDVSGIIAGTLSARFHSSWRPEFDGNYHQEGYILASYDGAEPVEILTWVSDRGSPNYHGNNQNEVVTLPLNNPDGAKNLQLSFGMREAGNDWWWAIDNLVVFGGAIASASADLGGSISFEVVADGTEPISYQWYRDGAAIEGGTGSILALTDLEAGDAGNYYVDVSNAANKVTSEMVSLTVHLPPTITGLFESAGGGIDLIAMAVVGDGDGDEPTIQQWSQNGTWVAGDHFELAATVTGAEPISYQWYFDGQPKLGQTDNPLRLPALSVEDSGEYHVVASNRLGRDTSEMFNLILTATRTVTEVTGSIDVIEGESVELSVTAFGGGALAYQWSRDNVVLEGATSPTYNLGNFKSTAAGNYTLAVSEGPVLVGSAEIAVAMVEPVTIVKQPGDKSDYPVSTLAGSGFKGSIDGNGVEAQFDGLRDIALDSSGNVYVADVGNHKIRKITPEGVVSTLAGSGSKGSIDGPGADAQFSMPNGIALDSSGNIYVTDLINHKIRKITPEGVVSTLAGSGASGSADGPGADAQFYWPRGIALDSSGNVYVADMHNNKIRKITPEGLVSTLAGSGSAGSADGLGADAQFSVPLGMALDSSENVYVADAINNKIRKITPEGLVSTLAGSGAAGSADGLGADAQFSFPWGVTLDSFENVYVADVGNHKIRKITPEGVVTTLAGSGSKGSADGPGGDAQFAYPSGIALDSSGNIYVADTINNKIRKIIPGGRSASADLGTTISIEVVATGAEPISYEWYHMGVLVAGANGSTLQLTNLEEEDAGGYHVVVSNIAGSVTSDTAVLKVELPPTITQLNTSSNADRLDLAATAEVTGEELLTYEWGQNGPILAGGDIELTPTVAGAEPMDYQWYFNGEIEVGKIDNPLRLPKVGVEVSGEYYVVAKNRLGEYTSETITLEVKPSTTITELAGSLSVYEGETIELSVTASGMTPLSYQWSFGGMEIDGATSAALSLNGIEADAAGDYKLAISHDGRLVGEAVITIVIPAARIKEQPVDVSKFEGQHHTFSVVAEGTEPITYKWYHSDSLIEEVTGSTLELKNLTAEEAGSYHVIVSNEELPWGGEETSNPVMLTVLIDIEIELAKSKLPETVEGNWQWALEGGSVNLSANAVGTPPLTYQWKKDGEAILGGTTPTITLDNIEPADAGKYKVTVTSTSPAHIQSDFEVQKESEVPIEVMVITPTTAQPAKIILQPEAVSLTIGETAELSVSVEGSAPISYQWYYADELIEDGTERILSIPDVQKANAGEYHVVVSNEGFPWGATETSDTATLTITAPPVIMKLTESMILSKGDTIELSVTAIGDEPLSYQWSLGGVAIEGATSVVLTLADATQSDVGDYTVTVSNAVSEVVSNVVSVTMPEPVRIVTQPQDVFVVAGASATMTVVVEGSEPIEYYWMHDAKWVDGGRGSTLSLSNLQAADFGAYNVLVRNSTGIEISKPAILSVMSPPEITQLSQSLTLIEGESVELTVTADGSEPLAYQWSKGGEAIDGATGPRLALADVTASDAGDFTVAVSNAAGEAESEVVTVKVIEPIRIVTQPEGGSAIVGDTVTLEVVVEGTEPISYYWYHDGELVEGATESILRLAKSQEADSGSYNVIVQNRGGTAISDIAELIVLVPPQITQLTESLTVIEGEGVELSVTVVGSEPLAYQWSKGDDVIEGATAPALRLAKATPTDAGGYSVMVTNSAGQAESEVVTVKVIEPLRIVTQPESATAILGETLTLQVVVRGTEPITYAWYHDGEPVEGGTEGILRLANVQAADAGGYHLVASNSAGTAKSRIAGLVVLLPPKITQLTESLSVMERDSVELSVTTVGSEPLTYQWSKDGSELEGATSPVLPLVRVAPAAAGDYSVAVSNAAGEAVSDAISVNVIEPVQIMIQPEGTTTTLGETVTLQIVAEGTEPINYFWLHNGKPVEGGKHNTLELTELEAEDSGQYVVMVSNIGGQVTSKSALLSVELPEGAYLVEDFDQLTLGPWVSDSQSGDGTDWTAAPPTDWMMVRGEDHGPTSGTDNGVVEFDGWTFLDPVSWQKTAGPERDQFTKGSGLIAVADSEQYAENIEANFNASLKTPVIDIADAQAGSLVLTYDSSWRQMQRKRVLASFEEDFEGDDVGEGVTIAGSAVQAMQFMRTGGAWPWLKLFGILKITEDVYSQSGGMLIGDFSNGAAFNEFEISFRLFMGRGTRRPADGLSVSIGNNLPTLAYPAEEGAPDAAFRVCFDAWDSGGGEAPAIEIFNGKKSIAIQKFHGQSGASDSEKFVKEDGEFLMMWHNSQWTDVNIRVADGLATVNFRGYDVIKNAPIDLSPIEAAQFLFAARTGGAHQKHYIDDIKIKLFDSSSSRVTVAYDGGEPVTLLELNSQTPTFYNETISLKLNNPVGAKSAVVAWDYEGYDNWWAVDNITVAADIEPEPTLSGLATDKDRYLIGEPVTVNFSDGPGNPRDWIGIYRLDMNPGEQGSLAWVYVNGSSTAGEGFSDGSLTFTNRLPAGDYVARYFKNDGYNQLSNAAAFMVVHPPGVATSKLNYDPGEAITVNFSNGSGNPGDWISLMPRGETSSIDWAYVGGTRTPSDGLANGSVTFAAGLLAGQYRVQFLSKDGYRSLASTEFTVAGQVTPPPLGFGNNGDGTITLTFEGRLQTAPTIHGPWQDMDAKSPVTLRTNQKKLFTRSVK
ncbi:MAG: immunoglobulin domain-containing protein [Verrucomicrobiota bacterium]|nr:immunoglobulin domain-containing protein [Verrucomicrobiota bacterium]